MSMLNNVKFTKNHSIHFAEFPLHTILDCITYFKQDKKNNKETTTKLINFNYTFKIFKKNFIFLNNFSTKIHFFTIFYSCISLNTTQETYP